MTSIAIYVEGGGDSTDSKQALRQGFDEILATQKNAARARRMGWKIVFCGGRNATFDAFANATTKHTADLVALVVDAEAPVACAEPNEPTPGERVRHLSSRDNRDFSGAAPSCIHLMTQCMEAWIVADTEKVAEYYGNGFQSSALPKRTVLDEEDKNRLYAALEAATKGTQKGSYGKIKHASELLKRIRPRVVAARCASFRQLTEWLDAAINAQ